MKRCSDIHSGLLDVWNITSNVYVHLGIMKKLPTAFEMVHRWLDGPINHTTEHTYSCKLSKLVSNLFGICISTQFFCQPSSNFIEVRICFYPESRSQSTQLVKKVCILCASVSFRFVLDESQSDRFDYNPYHL